MYQIEVLTTSESQETRIVRFNPQAVQRAVEDSLKNKIQVSVRCLKWAALHDNALPTFPRAPNPAALVKGPSTHVPDRS